MFLLFLLSLISALTFSLPMASSPLILGIWILIISAFVSSLFCLTLSSWISMITILVYIGGLNVLFAYFIATMPNQYLFSKPLLFSSIALSTCLFLNFLLSYPSLFFITQSNLLITKMLMNFDATIFLLLAVVLFLALVAVVKIASRHHGPLRPFLLS
uniref:NADH dehydrogenase subunit 6 n=1 Tax=Phascolosoma sp. MZK-2017 TaxID=1979532 RepID=A0A1W5YQB7_9ANNE|nr:NADH dehydrogenase subunit 6 [Phascolosoma sp. MZK-2017]